MAHLFRLSAANQIFQDFIRGALGPRQVNHQWWQDAWVEYYSWTPEHRDYMIQSMTETLRENTIIRGKWRDFQSMQTWIGNQLSLRPKNEVEMCHRQIGKLQVIKADNEIHGRNLQAIYIKHAPHRTTVPTNMLSKIQSCIQMFLNSVDADQQLADAQQRDLEARLQQIRRACPQEKVRGSPGTFLQEKAWQALAARSYEWPITVKPFNYNPSATGMWQMVKTIGEGGMGTAYIFLKFDVSGNVIDRIVKKVSLVAGGDSSPLTWKKHPYYGLVPLEWATQTIAARGLGARTILQPIALSSHGPYGNGDQWYTMWAQYAAHGDLYNLIETHQESAAMIPEPFAWAVLLSLAEAALIMKKGGVNSQIPAWQEIVHRDLKPENILLDLHDPVRFQCFPKVLVADWGLAIFTDKNDQSNPTWAAGAGTAGYYAPEQLSYINPHTGEPVDDWKLLSQCNIFGIGAVMHSVMHCRPLEEKDQDFQRQDSVYNMRSAMWFRYSSELRTVVAQCTHPFPHRRPTPEMLLKVILNQFDKRPDIKSFMNGHAPTMPIMCKAEEEKYKVGLAQWIPSHDGIGGFQSPRQLRVMNPDPDSEEEG